MVSSNPPAQVNPNDYDLDPACTAMSSGITTQNAIYSCLNGAVYDDWTWETTWSFAEALSSCGLQNGPAILEFIGWLYQGVDPMTAAHASFDPLDAHECLIDSVEFFMGN